MSTHILVVLIILAVFAVFAVFVVLIIFLVFIVCATLVGGKFGAGADLLLPVLSASIKVTGCECGIERECLAFHRIMRDSIKGPCKTTNCFRVGDMASAYLIV